MMSCPIHLAKYAKGHIRNTLQPSAIAIRVSGLLIQTTWLTKSR